MRNLFILFTLTVGSLISFSSCEKDLDISELQLTEKLVMNALVYDNEPVSLTLFKSLDIFDSLGKPQIENANVSIMDEAGNISQMKFDLVSQSYKTTWSPNPGIRYTINASWGDLYPVQSSFIIPKLNTIGKATWKDSTGKDIDGFFTGTISFTIKDDPNSRNYYEIGLFRYDEFSSEPWLNLPIIPQNPELINNPTINKKGALFVDDGGFNGQNKLFRFTTRAFTKGTTYKYMVVIKNLSEDYYRYFKSIENYQQQLGPFSEPSAVFTNVKGGLGICAGASLVKDTIR